MEYPSNLLSDYATFVQSKMANQEEIRQRVYASGPTATQLDNGARGVAEEAGEIQAVVKRYLEYGRPLDRERLLDEAGDLLFRLQQTLNAAGYSLAEALQANCRKLNARYKEGFTQEEAKDENRDRVKEAFAVSTPTEK